jgi:hypothetical protein
VHHQVQEFGDLGLERLGFGGWFGIGGSHHRARLIEKTEDCGKPRYSDTIFGGKLRFLRFSLREAGCARRSKSGVS